MKIIGLKKTDLEEIKMHRATLDAELKATIGHQNKFADLLEKQTQLQREIATLESDDPSEDSASRLTQKRTELELTDRRLNEAQPLDVDAQHRFRALLREGQQILSRILHPTYTDFLSPIISALRPYVTSDGLAGKLARETQAAKALKIRLFRDYAYAGIGGGEARYIAQILQQYDEILAGEITWTFNAKIS
jgi:hypothetical protein